MPPGWGCAIMGSTKFGSAGRASACSPWARSVYNGMVLEKEKEAAVRRQHRAKLLLLPAQQRQAGRGGLRPAESPLPRGRGLQEVPIRPPAAGAPGGPVLAGFPIPPGRFPAIGGAGHGGVYQREGAVPGLL